MLKKPRKISQGDCVKIKEKFDFKHSDYYFLKHIRFKFMYPLSELIKNSVQPIQVSSSLKSRNSLGNLRIAHKLTNFEVYITRSEHFPSS